MLLPFGRRKNRVRPDCRSTGALLVAEAIASAERKRDSLPTSAMSSATSPPPIPGRLRMRAASLQWLRDWLLRSRIAKGREIGRGVEQLAVDPYDATTVDGSGPVYLL